jgi:uncharacterized protein (TIGR03435 family)
MPRQPFAAVALALVGCAVLHAQRQAFEVASIKRNRSGDLVSSNRLQPGGRLSMTNRSLENIIREVYGFQTFQISGASEWMRNERWDIVAKAEGDPSFEQILGMMKTLLEERFKLASHYESREMPVFALVTAENGTRPAPQMRVSAASCPTQCRTNMSTGRIVGVGRSTTDIARNLSAVAGRAVVDKSHLTGSFDFELTWNETEQGPSLFTAVREQLGLKLEPQRGLVEVFVIDSAERPIED